MKRILAVIAVALVLTGLAGVGAYATSAAPPKAVGLCANAKNGGYVRMLESKNLSRSQYGKCRAGEVKVPVPTTVAKGATGARGASAFEVWRDHKTAAGAQPNKAKTEADYLASLQGRGVDGAPFKLSFTGAGPWTCTWQAVSGTLACVTP